MAFLVVIFYTKLVPRPIQSISCNIGQCVVCLSPLSATGDLRLLVEKCIAKIGNLRAPLSLKKNLWGFWVLFW